MAQCKEGGKNPWTGKDQEVLERKSGNELSKMVV
jgi:hypothetical protein